MTYTFPRPSISTPLHGPSVIPAGILRNPSTGRNSIASCAFNPAANPHITTVAVANIRFRILFPPLLTTHLLTYSPTHFISKTHSPPSAVRSTHHSANHPAPIAHASQPKVRPARLAAPVASDIAAAACPTG